MSSTPQAQRGFKLEALKNVVAILEDVASSVPPPGPAIINLVQRIITIVETVKNNRDECDQLRNRLLALLPVVAMTIQKHSTQVNDEVKMPTEVRQSAERLLENLMTIEKEVTKIKDIADSKRKRHKLTALFWSSAHAATLQRCKDDLDWAMNIFGVSSHLSNAIRLWEMSRNVEQVLVNQQAMSTKIERLGDDQHVISKKVEEVVSNQHATSTKVAEVAKNQYLTSTKVEEVVYNQQAMSMTVERFVDDQHFMSAKVEEVINNQHVTSTKVVEVVNNQRGTSAKVTAGLTNQYLEALPRAKYASFDSERPDRPSTCFEGTRIAILKLITDWVQDPVALRFFWLNGIAGIGKTTVACTISKYLRERGLLGGQFCFSRSGEAELRNPALVFPTIAYQLARFDPEFSQRITGALQADPEAPYASLKEQLDRLIVHPLAGLERDLSRVVVLVFDAFDECEARGAKEILQLLIAALPSLPFFLKIFVTSRPEHHIRSILVPANAKLRITALHDIETSIVKGDILLYLRERLRRLPAELGIDLPPDWITDHEIELLAEKAGNLFIHAATSLRFLSKDWDLREQLDILLAIITSPHSAADSDQPFADLDQLYRHILLSRIPLDSGDRISSRLRLVLGTIVLLRDPLPVDALDRLIFSGSSKATNTLEHLHSVILTPPPPDNCPRIYHPSFSDFLQTHHRCQNGQIWIDTPEHEGRMALQCLTLLNAKLHKGMLGDLDPTLLNSEVEDLELKVKAAFPPELQYACRYWASHLSNTPHTNNGVRAALGVFALETLLPWMEAMSWLGDTAIGIGCLEAAKSWTSQSMTSSLTNQLLNDGYRLLLSHVSTITLSAQHIAQSVLPFAPSEIALTSTYRNYANTCIKVVQGANSEWPPFLMVLNGHSDAAYSVSFSPDGTRLASGSRDQTVRLWEPSTGTCTAILKSHAGPVNSVNFSPDGTQLASASSDSTVKLWDTVTGTCMVTLQDSAEVYSTSFSSDGTRLVSGSRHHDVQLWDTSSGACINKLIGHSGAVDSVSFAPDGTQLASASSDQTVRVWNAASGSCTTRYEVALRARPKENNLNTRLARRPLFAYDRTGLVPDRASGHAISSVSFSPREARLACGSRDGTVRLRYPGTGTRATPMTGHSDMVNSVSFSPDGMQLASASSDLTVKLWDLNTHTCIATLEGHSGIVNSVTFSSNGTRLASASSDLTVRLWDPASTVHKVASRGHSSVVHLITFSPDGTRLASASYDKRLRFWNPSTGTCTALSEHHSGAINLIAFSPDGTRLASGSADQTVQLWDSTTGACVDTLKGQAEDPHTASFSADGSELVCRSRDGIVLLWDLATGVSLSIRGRRVGAIDWVVLSRDGKQLASGSPNGTAKLEGPTTHPYRLPHRPPLEAQYKRLAHSLRPYLRDNTELSNTIAHLPDALTGGQVNSASRASSKDADAFTHRDGRLYRESSGRSRLICFLPPGIGVETIASYRLHGEGDIVAIGCVSGQVIILNVYLS